MTQQKPLPIATRITGGFNVPSSFHPQVLHGDKIWHMPLGKSKAAATQRLVGQAGRKVGGERGQSMVFARWGRSTGSVFPSTLTGSPGTKEPVRMKPREQDLSSRAGREAHREAVELLPWDECTLPLATSDFNESSFIPEAVFVNPGLASCPSPRSSIISP